MKWDRDGRLITWDNTPRLIIVGERFRDAPDFADQYLGDVIDTDARRDELMVRSMSGRIYLFERMGHTNRLRGARNIGLLLLSEYYTSEQQHDVWDHWHRTKLLRGEISDPTLLCWAWTQEPLYEMLAKDNQRYAYNEYKAF